MAMATPLSSRNGCPVSPVCRLNNAPIPVPSRVNLVPPESSVSVGEITRLCASQKLPEAFAFLQENSKGGAFIPIDMASAAGFILQACGHQGDIETGRKVHHLISESGHLYANAFISNLLITMYSMCRSISESRYVFDSLRERSLFQWNAMISGYTRNELYDEAIELFIELVSVTEFKPDIFTLPCVIKACSGLLDADRGREIHGLSVKMGLNSNVFVGNALIAMYGKCGLIEDAMKTFEKFPERNLVSWNCIVGVFSEKELYKDSLHLFKRMLEEGFIVDDATLVTILPVCAKDGNIEIGMNLHSMAVKLRLSRYLKVNNALLDMYCKCGYLPEADALFDKLDRKNVVSWNSVIAGYSREGDTVRTFDLVRRMQKEKDKTEVNEVTILNMLPVFSDKSQIMNLKEVHGYIFRNNFQFNVMIANTLIASYANSTSLDSAELVFNGIGNKMKSSWNALLNGYVKNEDSIGALDFFYRMKATYLEPDSFTLSSIILACVHLRLLLHGKGIHSHLELDTVLTTSLLSLYTRCGKLMYARNLFERIENKGSVHWNAIISGYSQSGYLYEASDVFRKMLSDGIKPHPISLSSFLGACSQPSALRLGRQLHCYAVKNFLMEDSHIGCSIISMYGKTGSIQPAIKVFDRLKRGVASYNAIIAALGIHGLGRDTARIFEEMQRFGLDTDEYTFMGLLMACCHTGLVNEGMNYLIQMTNAFGIEPKLEHYACAIDMLGRAGRLADALKLIEEMPEKPDVGMWSSLLSCCRTYGNLETGEKVAQMLMELDPKRAETYVLLSNLYAKLGRWDDVRRVRGIMKEKSIHKEVGSSWIEVGGKIYSFIACDNSLQESEKIREMWKSLEEKLREVGYEPDLDAVLHELSREEKAEILRGHSEKLAISFGLLQTKKGTTLRIWKNLRICGDCHRAAKAVSKVVGREIIVRDNRRFHHFRDGSCSCRDYW